VRLVAEKVWHPSQKLTRKRDGSVVLQLVLADLDEVASWVLSFGPSALVLGPPALRQQVAEAAVATASRYTGALRNPERRSKDNG